MTQSYKLIAAILVIADLIFCFGIGLKTRGKSDSAEEYFIDRKSVV